MCFSWIKKVSLVLEQVLRMDFAKSLLNHAQPVLSPPTVAVKYPVSGIPIQKFTVM